MKISYSQLLNIVLVAILASSVFFMNTRSTIETKTASAGTYDPWLDYNEDGYIGIDDIFDTASSFGAEGDATKNVYITNAMIPTIFSAYEWGHYGIIHYAYPETFWNETKGYKEVSIIVGAGPSRVFVDVAFYPSMSTGVGAGINIDSFNVSEGSVNRIYPVISGGIYISIYTMNDTAEYAMTFYMTP